ncbi:MAG: DUF5931 domain-containing protein [Pseudonocardia sp.]
MAGGAELNLAERVLAPLWRGLVGYRVLAFGYACTLVVTGRADYRRPAVAIVVLAAVGVWTVVTTYSYLRARAAARWLSVADVAVTMVAVGATVLVQTPERIAGGAPVLTSVWSAGSPIAVALAYGGMRHRTVPGHRVDIRAADMNSEGDRERASRETVAGAAGGVGTTRRASASEERNERGAEQ